MVSLSHIQRATHYSTYPWLSRHSIHLGSVGNNVASNTDCAGDTPKGTLSCVEPIYIAARPRRVAWTESQPQRTQQPPMLPGCIYINTPTLSENVCRQILPIADAQAGLVCRLHSTDAAHGVVGKASYGHENRKCIPYLESSGHADCIHHARFL